MLGIVAQVRRQRQANLGVQGQPGVQYSQGYTEKHGLHRLKKQTKRTPQT